MMLKPVVIAAAGLAAASTAMLIPPEISSVATDIAKALPVPVVEAVDTREIDLPCPGCPVEFRGRDGKMKIKTERPNHLELTLAVVHGETHDQLLLNGFQLYPEPDPLHHPLMALQVLEDRHHHEHHGHHKKEHKKHHDDDENGEKRKEKHVKHKEHKLDSHHKFRPRPPMPKRLGFGLDVRPIQDSEDESLSLIRLDLQIIEVGDHFVKGIPEVQITVFKNGPRLLLNSLSIVQQNDAPSKKPKCKDVLCKWRAALEEHLSHVIPHKHCGHHNGTRGHHGHKDGENHPYMVYHTHTWAQLFKKFTKHILLPVLVGIIAGVTVSIIGMIIGTVIVGLWRKFVRKQSFFPHRCRRRSNSHRHKAAAKDAAVAEEKSGLMDDQEAPPSYEEADDKKTEL